MSGARRDTARLAPAFSAAEREALGAGTVWIEGELFSGRPDLRRLAEEPWPTALPEREQAFLDGPVEEVCAMVDPWRLDRERELPPEVWAYLKRHGFFGLSIPRRWGGLEFSALGRTAVFGMLAARSLPLSAVVLIPNSVGPGELLVEYGTEAQRERWLPPLARGEEIPCFALTEPEAGSDAASLASRGVLFRGDGREGQPDGEPMLRLDFDKRYVTLAPVATLIGLAFRLEDPEGLLAEVGNEHGGGEPGITVALVPAATPGVEIGKRHDPMGLPLPNGPIRGRGVVVPASAILGGLGLEGRSGAGRGWRMLMETLAGGRALSLPAQAAAGAKHVARVAGAYCAVRRQFGRPVAAFGGVEERLAAIAGRAYLLDAVRVWTAAAIDGGERPAVLSAAVKVLATEEARAAVADGMDVMGGAAICRGPRNLLADGWAGAPIGITVEGANILTRSLIVFGQGALRCHPHLGRLLAAAGRGRGAQAGALAGFLLGMARNGLRAGWLALTRGLLLHVPAKAPSARWWRRLARASARFAWTADLALAALGPAIKRREQVSGRLADALTWMIACAAVLRRFEAEAGQDERRREEDGPLVEWCAAYALSRVQQALEGVCRNLGGRGAGGVIGLWLRGPGLWALRIDPIAAPPSDRLGAEVAAAITRPGARRDRLIAGLPTGAGRGEALAKLEEALVLAARAEAAGSGLVSGGRPSLAPGAAGGEPASILPGEEQAAAALAAAEAARAEVIAADAFDPEEYSPRPGDRGVSPAAAAPVPATVEA